MKQNICLSLKMAANFFFLLLTLFNSVDVDSLELKQVLALSRHNIRTPLTVNLKDFTPREWPKWSEKPGHLTKKGAILEGYMGEYFFDWLNKERLLPDGCPDENSVYIYANTKERTKETAKAFAESAFHNCNVVVHHLNTMEMDPLFNPVIRNKTKAFKKIIVEKMQAKLDALQLADAYAELNRIIDIKNAYICNKDSFCNLADNKNEIVYKVGEEPNVFGPLSIGNSVVDSFIMSFYDGKPVEDVAWGEVTHPEQWQLLTEVTRQNQDVRFNLTTASRDFASPLIKYMSKILTNGTRKFTLLMGHDSNLNSVVSSLDFKPFVLPDQYEPFPMGGKIVFQKWTDGEFEYLKVEYVYQTWSKLRDGAKINLENPPQRVLMELRGCETNIKGLCPWSDFVKILQNF